jgi:hypothetical protein
MASRGKKRAGSRTGRKTGSKRTRSRKTKSKTTRRKSAGRELIAPRGDKRYVRRGRGGQFSESDDQRRSLSTDRRRKAKRKVKSGQGDRGDR